MQAASNIANAATGPAMLAERQLAAYNARDLEAFAACFSDDVEVYAFPDELSLKGKDAFRARYVERFKNEGLKAEILHRAIVGSRAIDHERVWLTGPETSDPIDLIVIYTVRDGVIARVDFVTEAV